MVATEWVFIAVALLGTIFGTITDLKGRWVPDWSNYALIFFGLGGHAILSVLTLSIKPILLSLAGAGFFYLISLAMFYSGAWGGGDAKLFIGLGALLPIYPIIISNYMQIATAPWPFLLTLWLNVMLVGVVFGLVSMFYLWAKHKQKVNKELMKSIKKYKLVVYGSLATLFIPGIMYLYTNWNLIAMLWVLTVMLIVSIFVTKAVEKACMHKIVRPSKLVEGDWVTEPVKIWGKTIYHPEKYGIEQKDIDKLIKLEKQGKLKNIKIKEGLPYVPAILVGLILSLFVGDLLYLLMGGLV